MKDYYRVLGVDERASREVIRAAYVHLLQKYHPDHNSSSDAHRITVELNEAFGTLGDDRKREAYDVMLRSMRGDSTYSSSAKDNRSSKTENREANVPDLRCVACGRKNHSIRLTQMSYVISLFVFTKRKGSSGLWCERCRASASAKYSLISALFGWWGFPWGLIYTPVALYTNAKGGIQDKESNAEILRVLGYQLYAQGNRQEAVSALKDSLDIAENQDSRSLYDYLIKQGTQEPRNGKWTWALITASPMLVIAIVIFVAFVAIARIPSGYVSRYKPPSGLPSSPVAPLRNASDDSRSKINSLADQLAAVVYQHATPNGEHMDGATRIYDYTLDRSKYDLAELENLSAQMRTEISTSPEDPDGFKASAYFNARLFELSVAIADGVQSGSVISGTILKVAALQNDRYISVWLEHSDYQKSYEKLLLLLRKVNYSYVPGESFEEMKNKIDSLTNTLRQENNTLAAYKSGGDIDSYNAMVPEYNDLISRRSKKIHALEGNYILYENLDLAFNKCLDPRVLMSQFQSVNLTTSAAPDNVDYEKSHTKQ